MGDKISVMTTGAFEFWKDRCSKLEKKVKDIEGRLPMGAGLPVSLETCLRDCCGKHESIDGEDLCPSCKADVSDQNKKIIDLDK